MSIFSGDSPPAWLQESTRPVDPGPIGQALGTQVAGGFLAASEGTSWSEGLAGAREAQKDPMWRLKQQEMQVQVLGQAAQAESKWQNLKLQRDEASAWMEDQPNIASYMKNGTPYVPTSDQGWKAMQIIDKQKMEKATIELRQDNAQSALRRGKLVQDFTDAYTADPNVQSQIEALGNDAWNIDPKTGQALSPSPKALAAYNAWATANDKLTFGATKADAESARQKAIAERQQENIAQRGDESRLTQTQKDEAAMKRTQAMSQNRIDVEKLKDLSRVDAQNRPLSKMQFINRHLNLVFKDLKTANPKATVNDAQTVLGDAYDQLPKEPGSMGGSGGTSDDPLGLGVFQKK